MNRSVSGHFFRYIILPLSALCSMVSPARALETDDNQSKIEAEEFIIPDWSISSNLSAMAGYRDNILLSSVDTESSGFIRGAADAMFLRLPEAGWDGYVYLDVTETRYLSSDRTKHERSGFVTSELRWQLTDKLKFGLTGQGYHHDQVFDVSVDQATLDTAQLKVTGGTLAPFVRWNFKTPWWVEVRGTGRKDRFADNIDGYTEGEGSLQAGYRWNSGSELSFGGAKRWRSHDFREQFTEAGRPLTGTRLKANQRELSMKYKFTPSAQNHWHVLLGALQVENRDNGSGFFDFTRRQFTAALHWKNSQWDVGLSTGFTDYDFPVQLVGIGINPEHRQKQEYRVSLEATRQLTTRLSVLAAYEMEQSRSNDDRSRFRTNTIYAGLQWNWDNLNFE